MKPKSLDEAAKEKYPPLYHQSSFDDNLGKRNAFIAGAEFERQRLDPLIQRMKVLIKFMVIADDDLRRIHSKEVLEAVEFELNATGEE